MHIAWIVSGSLDQTTGGYLYDRLIVDRLRAAGDDVRVISTGDPRRMPSARLVRSIALRARGCDVVVGDELCHHVLAPLWRALGAGPRRVALVHHLGAWEQPHGGARSHALRVVERAAIEGADRVIATSAWTAARLREEGLARTVDVVVPGADRLRRFARTRPLDDGRVRSVFVGSVVPRKRIGLILRAITRLDDPRFELVVVGHIGRDPRYARDVRRAMAGSPRLSHVVRLAGLASNEALARALADADALVLPSSLEGYGMVATEALFAGLPVIASRAGALPDVLGDDGASMLFTSGDADALAALLARFVASKELRASMREAARARSDRLPRWDESATAFRTLLTT